MFVNGRPLFYGDQSYRFDAPRREGLIGFDQARVYLPLDAGLNELAVLVVPFKRPTYERVIGEFEKFTR